MNSILKIALVVAVVIESVTVVAGLVGGGTGAEFAEAHKFPLLLRVHHGMWGLLLMVVALTFLRFPGFYTWIMGVGLGLFLSDLVHHLVVAPLLYGDMRWHWP